MSWQISLLLACAFGLVDHPTHTSCTVCIIEPEDDNGAAIRMSDANAKLIAAAPDLVEILQKTALSLDDMERANALLGRDQMAATCLVISNAIRNALAKAGVQA